MYHKKSLSMRLLQKPAPHATHPSEPMGSMSMVYGGPTSSLNTSPNYKDCLDGLNFLDHSHTTITPEPGRISPHKRARLAVPGEPIDALKKRAPRSPLRLRTRGHAVPPAAAI